MSIMADPPPKEKEKRKKRKKRFYMLSHSFFLERRGRDTGRRWDDDATKNGWLLVRRILSFLKPAVDFVFMLLPSSNMTLFGISKMYPSEQNEDEEDTCIQQETSLYKLLLYKN